MAVEENPLFDEWGKAWEIRDKREALYKAASKNGNKLLIVDAKAKLDDAQRIYDEICERL